MISKPLQKEANFFTESTCDINLVIFPQTTQKIFSGIHTNKYAEAETETEADNVS
jgi:hypothetical protein